MQNTLHHKGLDFNFTINEVSQDFSYFVRSEKTLKFLGDFYVGFQWIPTQVLKYSIKFILSILLMFVSYFLLYPVTIYISRKTRKIYKSVTEIIPIAPTSDLIRLKKMFDAPEVADKISKYNDSMVTDLPIVLLPLANALNQNFEMITKISTKISEQIDFDEKLMRSALDEPLPEWLIE